ncbi:MAG: RHS domain-containing protein, partial [Betaproteobacteria bacterium]|nr:RHS domain-containing protein [Betaproteobacteria bacterium]
QYDVQGLLTQDTDEDGRTRTYDYDTFQRLTNQSDALANATRYGYQIADGSNTGSLGSLIGPTDIQTPTSRKQIKYDSRERLTSETLINPNASGMHTIISSKTYDAKGQLQSETDADGKTRSYQYNALGQMIEATDALGGKTKKIYDARGNLIELTDAKGNATKFSYDRNDRLTKETLPLGETTSYHYDEAGNLIERTDPQGIKKQYTYDAANRLTEVKQLKAGVLIRTTTQTWDADNRLTGWTDTDPSRPAEHQTTQAAITYDDAGRKTGERVSYPNPAGSAYTLNYGYQYSLAGNKTSLIWPDGTAIGYGYSQHNELETVSIPGEGTISVSQFKWTAPAKITLPGGGAQEKTWDGLLKLESLKARTPGQQTTLDLTNTYGNRQEIKTANRTDTVNGSSSTKNAAYAYDDELRLVQVKSDTGWLFSDTEAFILDAVANRTQHSNTGSGVWQYDQNNRLLSRPDTNGGTVSYEYDQNGNQIKKTEGAKVTTFLYDSDNRLIEVKDQNNTIAKYGYDPFNRRLWKEQYRDRAGNLLTQATRTYYLYSDEGLIAEATQAIMLNAGSVTASQEPAITTQYGPKPDSPFTTGILFVKTKNSNGQNTIAYYHHNHLDTPIQATDKNGKVVWAAQIEAFGAVTIITPSPTAERPTITSNLRLPGQYEDQETGLHYNWNRYYDSQTGRYVTGDPIGIEGGANFYVYVGGNPVGYTDPLGLCRRGYKPMDGNPGVCVPDDRVEPDVCATGDCGIGYSPVMNCSCTIDCMKGDPPEDVKDFCNLIPSLRVRGVGVSVGEICEELLKGFSCSMKCDSFCRPPKDKPCP